MNIDPDDLSVSASLGFK